MAVGGRTDILIVLESSPTVLGHSNGIFVLPVSLWAVPVPVGGLQ